MSQCWSYLPFKGVIPPAKWQTLGVQTDLEWECLCYCATQRLCHYGHFKHVTKKLPVYLYWIMKSAVELVFKALLTVAGQQIVPFVTKVWWDSNLFSWWCWWLSLVCPLRMLLHSFHVICFASYMDNFNILNKILFSESLVIYLYIMRNISLFFSKKKNETKMENETKDFFWESHGNTTGFIYLCIQDCFQVEINLLYMWFDL